MRSFLDGLAGLKRRFLFVGLQIRTASAALSLHNFSYFTRLITGSTSGFRDPARLTRWTRGFLYGHLAIVLGSWSARALTTVLGPVHLPEVAGVVWFPLRMVVAFGVALLLPAWTLLANYNVRQLGASKMTFAPEWAAGWYFLPPGLVWKPYQVMQEVWKASAEPRDWRNQCGSPLVGWWWGMWLVSAWGGVLASLTAAVILEAGDAQAAESAIRIVRGLARVASTLFLLKIITRVQRMELERYKGVESIGQGLPTDARP